MIVIYLNADGKARAELVKHSSKFIEYPDGYHPMMDGGVIRDSEHKYPAIMLIWHNQFVPEGCKDTKEMDADILIENELIKITRGRPMINRLFFRRFWNGVIAAYRWAYFVAFMIVASYFFYLMLGVAT